jgi:hypothetical protein
MEQFTLADALARLPIRMNIRQSGPNYHAHKSGCGPRECARRRQQALHDSGLTERRALTTQKVIRL